MGQRSDLNSLLQLLLGSENVYFQPPANVEMVYPCIIYERDDMDTKFADNVPYTRTTRYSVTYVDYEPESPVIDKLAALPMCSFSRHFVAENLNHDVFNLYF